MCGGEPRGMLRKDRGKADAPIYTIQICIPKHGNILLLFPSILCMQTKTFNVILFTSLFCAALNLIFSFTNGVEWDGPYRLQFEVPKPLKNKPIEFFNRVTIQLFSLNQLPLVSYV